MPYGCAGVHGVDLDQMREAADQHFADDVETAAESDKKAVLVVGDAIAECNLDGTAARSHDQIDVGDFVTVTDQRFTY